MCTVEPAQYATHVRGALTALTGAPFRSHRGHYRPSYLGRAPAYRPVARRQDSNLRRATLPWPVSIPGRSKEGDSTSATSVLPPHAWMRASPQPSARRWPRTTTRSTLRDSCFLAKGLSWPTAWRARSLLSRTRSSSWLDGANTAALRNSSNVDRSASRPALGQRRSHGASCSTTMCSQATRTTAQPARRAPDRRACAARGRAQRASGPRP
jgi:hypothetical protein